MSKSLIGALLFLVFVQFANAQSFFSLQGEIAEPTESFREVAGTGFGVKATYLHYISSRLALTGSAGYIKWGPRSDFPPNNEYKTIAVPVLMGIDFLLSKGVVAPFVGISLGMNYLRVRGIAQNSTLYNDKSELKFTFSPHVGVAVYVAGPVGFLISGSYNAIYTQGSPSKFFGLSGGLAVGF